ncbi:MAG: peptidoglycan bridge formation glycyltransferase FemA/FemB family protein [Candidatus Staskawiczbacteria bacterium]|nr:peptidoglycan bridge formation glycyltransferase FemA/FemB family protein [Candidatus Staskawiczbacteria bacterium]
MFDVSICENKKEWDDFILENSNSFLQAFDWGNFQKKNGKKVTRMQARNGSQIAGQAQVFTERISFKNYSYIPYGPIFRKGLDKEQKTQVFKAIVNEIYKIAGKENCVFLRVEPIEQLGFVEGFKACAPFKRLQPQKTLVLDLTKTDNELEADFKPKTRQNINFSRKNGVTIKKEKSRLDDFCQLMKKTEERQEFGIYNNAYYKNILDLNGNVTSELFYAEFENKIINAIIVIFFGGKAFTLHGGSDYKYRHFKSANLLYWEIILEAKKRGFKEFDFWGIDEKKWPGVTTFKKSFGGREVEYPQGTDLIFNNFWYGLLNFLRTIKRMGK